MTGKSGVLNMIVPYGTGEREGLAASSDTLLRGRKVPVGGDRPNNAYGYTPKGRERRDVILPFLGECVYCWLGCENDAEVGSMCQTCYDRDQAEEAQYQAVVRRAITLARAESKNAWQRQYRANNREKVNRQERERHAARRAAKGAAPTA